MTLDPSFDRRASDASPTNNKAMGALGGGGAAGLVTCGVMLLLHKEYAFDPGPEMASLIGSTISSIVGGAIAWWTPVVTALQIALLRKIDNTR